MSTKLEVRDLKPVEPVNLDQWAQFKVENEKDAIFVVDKCKQLAKQIKAVETQRKEYTRPIDDAKAKLMADEKKLTGPYKAVLDLLREKVLAYLEGSLTDREREAEEQRLADIANLEEERANQMMLVTKFDSEEAMENVQKIDTNLGRLRSKSLVINKAIRGADATASLQERADFEVVDIGKVPAEFLTVDAKKVREAIKKHPIPGIQEKKKVSLVIA